MVSFLFTTKLHQDAESCLVNHHIHSSAPPSLPSFLLAVVPFLGVLGMHRDVRISLIKCKCCWSL